MWKEISMAIETPTITGEDIYLLDYFKPLIDTRAVDMVHPDPNSAGSVDNPWWDDLVTGIEKPIVQNGFVKVPETPGLGVELNDEAVREHLRPGTEFFAPTPEWDETRSWDRIWS